MKRIVLISILLYAHLAWGISNLHSKDFEGMSISFQDSLEWADYYYNIHRYKKAIPLYQKNLSEPDSIKTRILKKLALSEAALNNPEESTTFVQEYLIMEFNPSFLLNEGFDPIRESPSFEKVSARVLPKITIWPAFYFFIAVIGLYIVFVLVLNRKIALEPRILVGSFIFIHSLFMLNLSINLSNYVFEYPHTYLMSTWSSLLYGPLLYLYFKRISSGNRLKGLDFLHFLPSILLSLYLFTEIYSMSNQDKIVLMLNRLRYGLAPGDSEKLTIIVFLKASSLAIYGYLAYRILKKTVRKGSVDAKTKRWLANIYNIHVLYVFTYIIYGISIIWVSNSGILYHTPIVAMAVMVVYVGFAANVQPGVFSGNYEYSNRLFPKYKKSGLTESLSEELKLDLERLFSTEKLYRKNDLNLDYVSKKLNTSRHNTSQIINEHFKMGFHEYINKHRIEEAKKLLQENEHFNIIDVAYEVGYNNKVTFNKAFKKETSLTPSQYLNGLKPPNQ